jgi:hypothetical protein
MSKKILGGLGKVGKMLLADPAPAYTSKILESTTAKFADKIADANPKLSDAEVQKKALAQATKKLEWERVQKPALEKKYGALGKASFADSNPNKMQNTAKVVAERKRKANEFLDQPTEPWTPPRKELQAFDRASIKDAMEGFPDVEQSSFPRDIPTRASTSHVDELYADPENRALIEKQIKRGLPLGGETFYGSLYPVKQAVQEAGIPVDKFDKWIHSLAPASARNSIMNEMAVGQFLRNMNARGIPLTEENVAKEMAEYKKKFGIGLPLMPIHRQGVANVLEGGQNLREMSKANIPTNYKIPTYGTQKAGDFSKSVVLDVHEAGGHTQGSRFHPYFNEQGGFGNTEYGAGEQGLLGIAEDLGIPGGMAQAGRWFGGGELTGLRSPRGDALDLLEKQVAYTLKQKGIQPNPANVRAEVLNQIKTGEGDLLPYYRKEAMPDVRETGLQRAEGGAVDIDAADERLAAAIEKRMAKGGAVDIEAADARLQAAIDARLGMADGGGAFKKLEFMADGGKLVKGAKKVMDVLTKLPTGTEDAQKAVAAEMTARKAAQEAAYAPHTLPTAQGNKTIAKAKKTLNPQDEARFEAELREKNRQKLLGSNHPSIPKVVYHGTKRDFSEFKPKYADNLSFFSTNPEFASSWPSGSGGLRELSPENKEHYEELKKIEEELKQKYMQSHDYDDPDWASKYDAERAKVKEEMLAKTGFSSAVQYENKAGIQVMPVHLSVKNPFHPPTHHKDVEEILNKMPNMKGIVNEGLHKEGNWLIYENPEVINHLKKKGYDAIWLSEDLNGPHETIAPFTPNQIKSAIGNRGTYDINDPDITKAHGGIAMAKGGKFGNVLEGAKKVSKVLMAPQEEVIKAPSVIIPSKVSSVEQAIRHSKGEYGAKRVQRAADKIPNLERLYTEKALTQAFGGDNAKALMAMNPADFEEFAHPILELETRRRGVEPSKANYPTDEYIKYLSGLKGFDDVPFLEINKKEQGLPLIPYISGHEGRHRNRALANRGESAGLVQLLPRSELREPFPRRSQEEYLEALLKELEMTDNLVLPEKYFPADEYDFNKQIQRPAIKLPEIFAEGGGAFKTLQWKDDQHFDGGGIAVDLSEPSEDARREPALTEKDWANIKRNAPKLYKLAKEQVAQEASQLTTAGGAKDFALRTGAQFLGGIPDLINLGLMGVDAGLSTTRYPVNLSSERPWLGSERYLDALKESGAIGENEFPLAEITAGILAPAGLIKKGAKKLSKLTGMAKEPKKRLGGLTALSR